MEWAAAHQPAPTPPTRVDLAAARAERAGRARSVPWPTRCVRVQNNSPSAGRKNTCAANSAAFARNQRSRAARGAGQRRRPRRQLYQVRPHPLGGTEPGGLLAPLHDRSDERVRLGAADPEFLRQEPGREPHRRETMALAPRPDRLRRWIALIMKREPDREDFQTLRSRGRLLGSLQVQAQPHDSRRGTPRRIPIVRSREVVPLEAETLPRAVAAQYLAAVLGAMPGGDPGGAGRGGR